MEGDDNEEEATCEKHHTVEGRKEGRRESEEATEQGNGGGAKMYE